MIILAIDTSDARGSVAVLKEGAMGALQAHQNGSDYSGWLLPAVHRVLAEAGSRMDGVDLLAVSTGPGSFTGLRVGLTTAKAWSEVYGKPIVGVSRLEAVAHSLTPNAGWIASSYDAQRGQLFGALYKVALNGLMLVGEEMVLSPDEFVQLVTDQAHGQPVAWISQDPKLMEERDSFRDRLAAGDSLHLSPLELAPVIARLAEERAKAGQFSDPLALDANYVRRSDAEIFWKGPSTGVR